MQHVEGYQHSQFTHPEFEPLHQDEFSFSFYSLTIAVLEAIPSLFKIQFQSFASNPYSRQATQQAEPVSHYSNHSSIWL